MRYFAVLVLLLPRLAAAQAPARLALPAPSTNEARQPAETVLSASLAAHGGTQLLSVQTILLRGTSTIGKTGQPVRISATMEGGSRIEYGQPASRTIVTTAQGRFEVRNGQIVIRPPHSGAYSTLDIFSVLGIRGIYASGGNRGIVGTMASNGRDVLRVHGGTDKQQTHYSRTLKDELDVDFDTQTGHIAAVHRWESADGSLDFKFLTSYAFGDYRDVQGLLLPFRIEISLDGRVRETLAVDSYEVNPVFPRDLFRR